MPPKKNAPNKSDFIRTHIDLPTDEIIKQAKEAGLIVSPTLIYKVRSRGNAKPTKKVASVAKKPAAAKAAAVPATSGAKKMSASDFIRSQPRNLPASEVVKRGAKEGLKFSLNLVYAVRSATKKPGKAATSAKGKPTPKPTVTSTAPADGTSPTVILSKLVVEHGIGRVREMLAEVERRVERVLAGG